MRCIFCKAPSSGSSSREHIIPESLGNKSHVLPRGWVCDRCNNYLARKVEDPFLNSFYGRHARFEMGIPNKENRVPPITGLHAQSKSAVKVWTEESGLHIGPTRKEDGDRLFRSLLTQKSGTLYLPISDLPPPDYVTARFIGKVAMEIMAHRCLDVEGWNQEIVDKPQLDELRNYVRLGRPGFVWPVHIRRIYPNPLSIALRRTQARLSIALSRAVRVQSTDGTGP